MREPVIGPEPLGREAHVFPGPHLVLTAEPLAQPPCRMLINRLVGRADLHPECASAASCSFDGFRLHFGDPGAVACIRVLTRFVLKYTLRAAHLELGGVEREVRRSGKP